MFKKNQMRLNPIAIGYTSQPKFIIFLWVYELLANSEPILSPKYDGVLSFSIMAKVLEHFGF